MLSVNYCVVAWLERIVSALHLRSARCMSRIRARRFRSIAAIRDALSISSFASREGAEGTVCGCSALIWTDGTGCGVGWSVGLAKFW